ncbi:sensor histidine kinase, partial [Flavobacterium sp.]|uniref:sensor histidine kinase n=1 Tax=Flavobacterium sp. TaxID=239 RepID=UPI00374DBF79
MKINSPNLMLLLAITLLVLNAQILNAQKIASFDSKKTLLMVSAGFYTVKSFAKVDLDSSLVISALRYRGNKIPIICEGFEDAFITRNCGWLNSNSEPDYIIKQLNKTKGPEHTRLCLLLGAFYSFHSGFDKKYTDLGIKFLTQAKKEADLQQNQLWSLQATCLLGKCYMKQGNIERGKLWFNIITDNKSANDEIKAKAWNYEGMYCPFLAETGAFRLVCLKKADKLYDKLKDNGNQINTLMNIGYMSFAVGNIKDSNEATLKSLSIQKRNGFIHQQYSYDLLAFLSGLVLKVPSQIKFAMNAVSFAEKNKDSLNMGHFYESVAGAYTNEKEQNETAHWRDKALQSFQKYGGDAELWVTLLDLSNDNFTTEKANALISLIEKTWKKDPPPDAMAEKNAYQALGVCYNKLGIYTKEQSYLLAAKKLDKKNTMVRGGISDSRLDFVIGKNYFHLKQIDSSRKYLMKAIKAPQVSNINLMNAYLVLYKNDSMQGNYRDAMINLKTFSDMYTESTNQIESKQIVDLSIKYHTLQREKKIQSLEISNVLQKQKDESARKIFYAGIIVLLLLIGLIYGRYYLNKKRNKEIDAQNLVLQKMNAQQETLIGEKELLLREIHHRVKNNLQTTVSLLNIQSAHIDNEVALETIRSSQRRMQAMSLIHQKLYQSE